MENTPIRLLRMIVTPAKDCSISPAPVGSAWLRLIGKAWLSCGVRDGVTCALYTGRSARSTPHKIGPKISLLRRLPPPPPPGIPIKIAIFFPSPQPPYGTNRPLGGGERAVEGLNVINGPKCNKLSSCQLQ